MDYAVEQLGGGVSVCVTPAHTFGTDSFLLSDFATPGPSNTACDLGCGCGVIPLLWFRDRQSGPRYAYAVDIQEQAAEQARQSVSLSGLEDRLSVLQADLRALGPFGDKGMDLVTCNPPYNAAGSGLPSQSDSERIARHETLCTLDDVCACAGRLLRFGGRLCLCQLPERLADVLEAMRRYRLEPKRLRFVQQRTDTAPWLFLVEGKLGSKPFLRMEPPLVLQGADRTDSPELCRIYTGYRTSGK